jgi:hypothetical protein
MQISSPDFNNTAATGLKIVIKCFPRISVSHVNTIHVTEPRTGSTRTLACCFQILFRITKLWTGNARTLASRLRDTVSRGDVKKM